MPKLIFGTAIVLKLIASVAMALGIYVGIAGLLDGQIIFALLVFFLIIPIGLGILGFALGIIQMIIVTPIAFGRTREMSEFNSLSLEVADRLGADRLTLRQIKAMVGMYAEIPPSNPNEGRRSGAELIRLYDAMHRQDTSGEENLPAGVSAPAD